METQSKRLWIVTLANIAVVSLLLLAPATWPLYILSPIGLALSVTGLRFRKGVVSRASRRVASAVNGCAFAFDLVIILSLATHFFRSTARFLVPDGYEGDVYVVEARDGESLNKTLWGRRVTYRIPQDGILRTRELSREGLTWMGYYYERQDGSVECSLSFSPATLRVPENLANHRDIWLFRIGGLFTCSTGSSIPYEHFYVGTEAHLVSKYRRIDFGRYVRDHPIGCSK